MEKAEKPIIGITCGDLNGIGIELIIKTFADHRILDHCTPVVFGSNKVFNFYRKSMPEINFSYQSARDLQKLNTKQLNIYNCWEEDVSIIPGQLTEVSGQYAIKSLVAGVDALKNKMIDGLVTAPIHKKNTHSTEFNFTGHTPYLKNVFQVNDVVMLLCAGAFRVGLVTEHVPISEVSSLITKEAILSKLKLLNKSLKEDFDISTPKFAVLGLNPHAGDEGLTGKEEEDIIKPAIKEARLNQNILAFGPFSPDAFFARGHHHEFDAVLAMYHDQGLIPFKSLAGEKGINFTAGLPAVRTSPDHGVAFDIAGKNTADATSFMEAIFECIDIINHRRLYDELRKNPLKKISATVVGNVVDEKIEEEGN
ncbi:MAG: 4-hydroxythreonine-4-phosphate dehydrogenase PdxA [Chitinophagaceae bacterium]|jgi:4-hydroxythreonine-4-phosphate dehydrogenase|nr:4-hydroxythreonine-4-phosphate dehydrogenase PdxA [Chitinophagaceae bacterium]